MNTQKSNPYCEGNPLQSYSKRQGLTLVELLVGMVAASILMLTAGIMLFNFSRDCRRNREGISMQEDGRVAMEAIARVVRAASLSNVVAYSSSDLRVTVTGIVQRIYANGTTLVYNPNMNSGNSITLVSGGLTSFIVAKTNSAASTATNCVAVSLSMVAGDSTHVETITGVFTCRN